MLAQVDELARQSSIFSVSSPRVTGSCVLFVAINGYPFYGTYWLMRAARFFFSLRRTDRRTRLEPHIAAEAAIYAGSWLDGLSPPIPQNLDEPLVENAQHVSGPRLAQRVTSDGDQVRVQGPSR
jgi:hypothetical protein